MTMKELEELSKYALKNAVKPLVVETDEQARELNDREAMIRIYFPTYIGHVWKKGDTFYNLSEML